MCETRGRPLSHFSTLKRDAHFMQLGKTFWIRGGISNGGEFHLHSSFDRGGGDGRLLNPKPVAKCNKPQWYAVDSAKKIYSARSRDNPPVVVGVLPSHPRPRPPRSDGSSASRRPLRRRPPRSGGSGRGRRRWSRTTPQRPP